MLLGYILDREEGGGRRGEDGGLSRLVREEEVGGRGEEEGRG